MLYEKRRSAVCRLKTVMYVDCPSSVTVTPSSGRYKPGDVLTCMADGHPEPSYTWTDSEGVVVSTARRITLSEGPFNLTCTATGNFTTPCSASSTISGYASVRGVGMLFDRLLVFRVLTNNELLSVLLILALLMAIDLVRC